MPRRPGVPGKPARTLVPVKLTTDDVAALDVARGDVSRSEWIREVIRAEFAGRVGVYPGKQIENDTAPETPEVETPEVVTVVPQRTDFVEKNSDKPHRHMADTVATRTIKGVTVKTRKCMICGETWETT
jgi:hypothetical protein